MKVKIIGEKIEKVYDLCVKHSKQIESAIQRLNSLYNRPFKPAKPNSFFSLIVGTRAYKNIEREEKNEVVKSNDLKGKK